MRLRKKLTAPAVFQLMLFLIACISIWEQDWLALTVKETELAALKYWNGSC